MSSVIRRIIPQYLSAFLDQVLNQDMANVILKEAVKRDISFPQREYVTINDFDPADETKERCRDLKFVMQNYGEFFTVAGYDECGDLKYYGYGKSSTKEMQLERYDHQYNFLNFTQRSKKLPQIVESF